MVAVVPTTFPLLSVHEYREAGPKMMSMVVVPSDAPGQVTLAYVVAVTGYWQNSKEEPGAKSWVTILFGAATVPEKILILEMALLG